MADPVSNPETPTPRPLRPVFMVLRAGCSDAIDLTIEFSVFHGLKAGPAQIDLDETTSPIRQTASPIRPPIYACDEGSLMKESKTLAYDDGSLMEESPIYAFEEGSLIEQTQEPISRYGVHKNDVLPPGHAPSAPFSWAPRAF